MVRLRKTLFYLFALGYLIFCPLIIMRAIGFNFRATTPRIERTGIIYLSTVPSGATVYLDDKRLLDTTPLIIRDLRQGDYHIRLQLPRHLPWERVLSVKGEKATAAEDILLIPRQWPARQITLELEHLIPTSDTPFVLLQKGPLLKDLFIWRERFESRNERAPQELLPLASEESDFAQATVTTCHTIKGSPFVLIEARWNNRNKFFWSDLDAREPVLEDISYLFLQRPVKFWWEPNNRRVIFALLSDGSVNQINTAAQAVYPRIIENVESFSLRDGKIYVLTQNQVLERFGNRDSRPEILLADPDLRYHLFGRAEDLSLHVFSEDIILFQTNSGGLIANRPPYLFIESGVKGLVFDEKNQKVLVWTREDLGILDFSKKTNEESDNGPILTWLGVKGKDIEQAFWVNNGAQILFRDHNRVLLTDTNFVGQAVPSEVTIVKNGSSVVYLDNVGKLFYLDPQTHYFSFVQILPQLPIFSFPSSEQAPSRSSSP